MDDSSLLLTNSNYFLSKEFIGYVEVVRRIYSLWHPVLLQPLFWYAIFLTDQLYNCLRLSPTQATPSVCVAEQCLRSVLEAHRSELLWMKKNPNWVPSEWT